MKRNLRFYFALFFAKGTAMVLKLIRRKGTSMPGSWAIILCPDFLGRMPRPETVIGITGTNGKTTVSNMVEDVLEQCGYDFICNRSGTNVNSGVASTLIANSRFFGKPKKKLAVFELDERSSPKILPYIKPDLLLCTNIFRDSYKRNAHMEFILDILEKYIPESTKLILNSDDLLCAGLKELNRRTFFAIDRMEGDRQKCENIVQDITVCPKCDGPLIWNFVRYHHIGQAHCPQCGYHSPEPQYRVKEMDGEKGTMELAIRQKDGSNLEKTFPLANGNTINVYNSLSAIALLCEFGLSPELVCSSMEQLSISESRYSEEEVGGRKVILHLAKGQNPIACSRVFDNIRQYPGNKAVILFLDDYFDAAHSVENTSWFYDTDFEFLNHPDIHQLVIAGARHWDEYVRMLLAGVPEEKIIHMEDNEKAAFALKPEGIDTVFILYDVYTIGLANRVKDQVKSLLSNTHIPAPPVPLTPEVDTFPMDLKSAAGAPSATTQPSSPPPPVGAPDATRSAPPARGRVEVLFPEFCNLFGDSSNMLYLKACLPDAAFISTAFQEEPRFLTEEIDLVYLGPMTERTQRRVIEKLRPHAQRIEELIQQGKTFLCTGNALEVFGESIVRDDGSTVKALDIFPVTAKQDMMNRHNSIFLGTYQNESVMGFKSQFTTASCRADSMALFEVKKGMGLNPKQSYEGIVYKNFIGTYLLGPILICNPPFTRDLLRRMGIPDAPLALEAQVTAAYQDRLQDF